MFEDKSEQFQADAKSAYDNHMAKHNEDGMPAGDNDMTVNTVDEETFDDAVP